MANLSETLRRAKHAIAESVLTQALRAKWQRRRAPSQFILGPLVVKPHHAFLELDLEIDVPVAQAESYAYSKLYFGCDLRRGFTEDNVVRFRLQNNRQPERVRIALPEQVCSAGWAVLRLDVLPDAQGSAKLCGYRLVSEDDACPAFTRVGVAQFVLGPLVVKPHHAILELDLETDLPATQAESYAYSEVNFGHDFRQGFTEQNAIRFRLQNGRQPERVRIALPEQVCSAGQAVMHLDVLPYAPGSANLSGYRLVSGDDERPAFTCVGKAQFVLGPLVVKPRHAFLDLDLEIDLPWSQTRSYEYSKLYFGHDFGQGFTEENVICFRLQNNRRPERVRIALPEQVCSAGQTVMRLDVFPYAQGTARLSGCRLVNGDDADAALADAARYDAIKAHTRAMVIESENTDAVDLPHYPESLGLETQPGCNLTCGHCSSHGTPELHRRHNSLREMDRGMLAKLAHEVFPHLTTVNIVGRGEPLMVSDGLWEDLIGYLRRYRVFLSVTTNGYFVERRITADVLPLIDTLAVSIDGLRPETFAENRGGASFDKVLAGIRWYHELRKQACLPRRPKLCLSWTLKKNNIAEFPDFVRLVAPLEPDRFYVRHLLLFQEKDRQQSLLDTPETANRYLREAYALLEEYGIETDCPPLFEVKPDAVVAPVPAEVCAATSAAPAEGCQEDSRCTYVRRTGVLLAGGEMSTCGVQYAEKAGDLQAADSFLALWNGPVMQGIRRVLNTPQQWAQCRDCWFRQSRYYGQREERANRRAYSMQQIASFSKKAWDFCGCEQPAER
jgi:MoaA/NifB/PqqE/SkfB family radical SAM enzyme